MCYDRFYFISKFWNINVHKSIRIVPYNTQLSSIIDLQKNLCNSDKQEDSEYEPSEELSIDDLYALENQLSPVVSIIREGIHDYSDD